MNRNMMYRQETMPIGRVNLPRFHSAGLKIRRPTVCRATIGIMYDALVAIVAVAVMAPKATVLPMTAHVMAMPTPHTRNAALTGILFLFKRRKILENGKTPSLEMANVTRWADMKQDAAAHVESTHRRLRIATAPFGPIVWTRYSAQLFE